MAGFCSGTILRTEITSASRTRPWLLSGREYRVGVFPEREKILIGTLGFGGVALHGVGSTNLKTSNRADRSVPYNSAVVQDFLEFSRCFGPSMNG